jgi:hypothetical protein
MAETPISMTVEQLARTMSAAKTRERAKIAGEITGMADAALGDGKLEVSDALRAVASYVLGSPLSSLIQPDAYDAAVAARSGDLAGEYDADDLPAVKLNDDALDVHELIARRPASGFNPSAQ